MEIISKILAAVLVDEYLPLLAVFIFCALFLMAINIILGTVKGGIKSEFSFKKLIAGIIKAIVIAIAVFAFGFVVDLFVVAWNTLGVLEIETKLVTVLELIAVIAAICVDTSMDIIDKIKCLRDLKHITYEEIHYNDGNGASK